MITRIDRLVCGLRDLQTVVTRLQEKEASLVAAEQPVDTPKASLPQGGAAFISDALPELIWMPLLRG